MYRYLLLGLSLILFASVALAKAQPDQYQIGEQWSRIFYNGQLTLNDTLNDLLKATARVDLKDEIGTAFYVGKFQGKHVMMTNYHVLSNASQCVDGKVYFQHQNRKYRCGRIIAQIKNLELTFFSIRVSKKDEYLFHDLALKFDFKNEHLPGEQLLTAGHGVNLNPRNHLSYEVSQTCVLATPTQYPKFIKLKGKFNAMSFVHACEISQGDSGSALMSAASGKVIGVNWASASSKPLALLNSNVVFKWIKEQVEALWPSLSLGVPNSQIYHAIQELKHPVLMEFVNSNL